MSFWPNPKRLSEPGSDAPEVLREALQEARASRVANEQVRRVAGKLLPLVAAGAAAPLATKAVGSIWPAAKFSALVKIAGAVVAAGIAVTAAFFAYPFNRAASPEKGITPSIPAVSPAPASPPAVSRPPDEAKEEGLPELLPETATAARPARERNAAKRAPVKADPAAELALLKSAQQMLEKQPKVTLALVKEHEREYANGIFAQEREMLAIEALLKLGRREEARQRGERFLSLYPESAHVRRVHNLMKQYPARSEEPPSR